MSLSQSKYLSTILLLVSVEDIDLDHCVFARRGKVRLACRLIEAIKHAVGMIDNSDVNKIAKAHILSTIETDIAEIENDITALQKYLVMRILESESAKI